MGATSGEAATALEWIWIGERNGAGDTGMRGVCKILGGEEKGG